MEELSEGINLSEPLMPVLYLRRAVVALAFPQSCCASCPHSCCVFFESRRGVFCAPVVKVISWFGASPDVPARMIAAGLDACSLGVAMATSDSCGHSYSSFCAPWACSNLQCLVFEALAAAPIEVLAEGLIHRLFPAASAIPSPHCWRSHEAQKGYSQFHHHPEPAASSLAS